jgi:pimeloyl-ACP methyl ester carboxylesterase
MPWFSSNGARLYYALDGEGDIAFVMLHCLPTDHRIWMNQIFYLSPNFKTVALDFRGLGHSEKVVEACTMISLADDVNNLMIQERIEKAIIMGVSIGGSVALQFAVRYPEKVRALVLSGTSYSSKDARHQDRFSGRIAGYSSADPASYYASHVRFLFSEEYASSEMGKNIIESYTDRSGQLDFRSIVRLIEALKENDLESSVSSIKVPTLVIAGEKDQSFPTCRLIADRISGSKFVKVLGAGHAVNLENPVQYNSALGDFLRGLSIHK